MPPRPNPAPCKVGFPFSQQTPQIFIRLFALFPLFRFFRFFDFSRFRLFDFFAFFGFFAFSLLSLFRFCENHSKPFDPISSKKYLIDA